MLVHSSPNELARGVLDRLLSSRMPTWFMTSLTLLHLNVEF